MTTATQTDGLARHKAPSIPLPAALAALGIVYGDIGTSPLYAFKQAVDAGGTLSPGMITGIVSLILWSLIMIISLKYAILIMRADNRGEGGIVALLALLDARHASPGTRQASRGWPHRRSTSIRGRGHYARNIRPERGRRAKGRCATPGVNRGPSQCINPGRIVPGSA